MKKINNQRLYKLLGAFSAFVLYYVLFRFKVLIINCPIRQIFHVYCPGCGVSRMLLALTKFKFKEAFSYNQLAFILLPFLSILLVDYIISYLYDKPNKIIDKIPLWVYILISIIIVAFGIIRNLPEFYYLTPLG